LFALACQSLFTIQTSWMGSFKDCDDSYVYTTPSKWRCPINLPVLGPLRPFLSNPRLTFALRRNSQFAAEGEDIWAGEHVSIGLEDLSRPARITQVAGCQRRQSISIDDFVRWNGRL
jgi:hypothetical protein